MPQLNESERQRERGGEGEGESQKVNRNHNSDNFIYNTLEELYFIYSFKCDDEAAEPRAEIRTNGQGPVTPLLSSPLPPVCVFSL